MRNGAARGRSQILLAGYDGTRSSSVITVARMLRRSAGANRQLVAEVVVALRISRPISGRCNTQRPGPQTAELLALWSYRSGSNHVLAGAYWRRPQLGLPLLLAARCLFDCQRTIWSRLSRRSRSVH